MDLRDKDLDLVESLKEEIRKELEEEYKTKEKKSLEEVKKDTKKATEDKLSEQRKLAMKLRDTDPDELVPVQSYFNGIQKLKLNPREYPGFHDMHVFQEFGDIEWVRFEFLQKLVGVHRKLFTKPTLYILDEEVAKVLRVHRYQKDLLEPDALEKVFEGTTREMIEFIEGSSTNIRKLLRSMAIEKINNNEINDLNVIKVLKEKLNFEIEG